MIYQPAEDSELLAREIVKRACGKKVLDVGCGSGVQMEAALKARASEVLGVDIDLESLDFCKKKRLNVLKSDLFSNLENLRFSIPKTSKNRKEVSGIKGKFDLIVFNPPYLPEDEREDEESGRATSGGKKGDEIIVRFLREVGDYLERGGRILLVVSSLTPSEEIERVLQERGFEKKVAASAEFFMEELEVWELF